MLRVHVSITNAQIAVDLYKQLSEKHKWSAADAWKGIAIMLPTCEVWGVGWQAFQNIVVYRERNDFKNGPQGPSAVVKRSGNTGYLAEQLGISRVELCENIGTTTSTARFVGAASQSGRPRLPVHWCTLQAYGDPEVTYQRGGQSQ